MKFINWLLRRDTQAVKVKYGGLYFKQTVTTKSKNSTIKQTATIKGSNNSINQSVVHRETKRNR